MAQVPSPQQGILNHPPDHALLIALDFIAADPTTARADLDRLQDLVRRELRSKLDETTPASPKDVPSAETGELGFDSDYERYHLTITVGFGLNAYTRLGFTANLPADLRDVPWDDLKDSPVVAGQSDLLLQVCTDSIYLAEHVVRRITEELPSAFSVRWVLPGSQRHNSRAGRASRKEGRALIGFLDGTSNLHPRDVPEDRRLVFVDPDDRTDLPPQAPDITASNNPYGGPQPPQFPPDLQPPPGAEPAWTKEGTYMVLRASLIATPGWDATNLGEQENAIGRRKVTGNPLGFTLDTDVSQDPIPEPNFAEADSATPLNAHIRKANPRGPGDDLRRIFRRGYPVILPTTEGLKLGLAFVCFGRTITTQFEFITRAWTTNPNFPEPNAGEDRFRSFEAGVLAGGYYFVPPLEQKSKPWTWQLPS